MKILVSWLREFVAADAGPQELADALTNCGFEVSDISPAPGASAGGGADAVLDLEITTNRPDCLSVRGVAREVSAIYGLPLLEGARAGGGEPPGDGDGGGAVELPITIEDPDLCPRYAAAVDDVTIGPSPGWLQARLDAADMRPINNVVDATNYVMLELGQPLHAFDLARLGGPALRIRRAARGETIQTLDGQERKLDTEMLVIADAGRPQALAGVMGGAASEVSESTRTVVLESACFEAVSVRRTSKRTALSTDASFRFERGTDIETPVAALRRLRRLLAEIAGGRPRGPIADCYPAPRPTTAIELRHSRVG
ncbi:MAG: phenylalanine--tRNA ligase beta subunit-related protein, partial [Acidobacteriota bacterium]|nr:phenylalanine--tRNA ligase beta subunit-related protein [Acidobacteriota bacterium]